MTATRLECTTAEYLADPAPEPSLSSSIAKVLIEESAAHAYLAHPRFGGAKSAPTSAMDHGTLIHRLLLGKGAEIVHVVAGDWRTKAAKAARAEARETGQIPVLAQQAGIAEFAASAIKVGLANVGVSLDGDSEVPILWQEQAAHGPIWCRAMLDHVVELNGMLHVYDVKTIESAHPESCTRSAINFGYDIQQEAYTRAAEALWPDYAGRVVFRFLFVETEPPYAVTVAGLDGVMRERGRRRWREAVETWSRCLHTETWPSYTKGPVTLQSPGWLLQRESEAAEARGETLVFDE